MGKEERYLSTAFAIAELLAQGRSQLELAHIASFFSSISANIGLIVQTRNVELANRGTAEPVEELASEELTGAR